jgi:hypothetical protein
LRAATKASVLLLLNAETLADVAGRVSPRSFRCRPLHLKSFILPSSPSSLYSVSPLFFLYNSSIANRGETKDSSDEKRGPNVQMSRVFCRGLARIPRVEEWNEATFACEVPPNFKMLDTQASPSTFCEMRRAFLGEEEIVISVTLLEFMMPSVKVNMEYHDGAVRQTS